MTMDATTRAAALTRFLIRRAPSPAELQRLEALRFDCDRFLIELLCSDEAASLYGDITQYMVDHVRAGMRANEQPHKLAHNLVLMKEDLEKLQRRFDLMEGQLMELLRHEDRIAAIFDGVRVIQDEINMARSRIESVENSMLRSRLEMAHG
jgi:hypothetical protein